MRYQIIKVELLPKPLEVELPLKAHGEEEALRKLEGLVLDAEYEGRGRPLGGPFVFGKFLCQAVVS